jgi:hypothetical protein
LSDLITLFVSAGVVQKSLVLPSNLQRRPSVACYRAGLGVGKVYGFELLPRLWKSSAFDLQVVVKNEFMFDVRAILAVWHSRCLSPC